MSLNAGESNQTIERIVLANGITLIVVENQAADLIAGRFFLKNAGSIWEKREQAGLSHLVSAVITKGTANLSAIEIAEKVESVGASLGADASADYFLLSLKTVATDFPVMLELLGEIMRSPTFPEGEVELEKKLTSQSIRSQQEQPFNVAFNQLREMMYPQHLYGVSILGTEETVANLSSQDLQTYHQTYFRPDNLVISISGRITETEAVSLVEQVFGDWQIPTQSLPTRESSFVEVSPGTQTIPQDTQQSIIMLGYLTSSVNSEDYPVLKLLSTYLGNGLSSRLFVELREKRGLAYDVSAFYPTRIDVAPFVSYIGTAPENTEIALSGLRTEIERLAKIELTETELQGAKNKLLGQYALGKQTNSEIAQIFGWYESLGLGMEFDDRFQKSVAQVTSKQALEAANSYLTKPYISLVGSNF